jgi:DNA-binding MarR family transcriptional regulator
LDEREFELVNILGANLGANQRQLSRLMNLSLGQTNMLIRRLASKGYIRISQLNQKKVQYLLTPKGLREKLDKSIKYTLKTINSISLIKVRIKDIIGQVYAQGQRQFYILGKSDFAVLVEMGIKDLGLTDCTVEYIDEVASDLDFGAVLVCREKVAVKGSNTLKMVDVLYELSKDGLLHGESVVGIKAEDNV